MDKHPSPQNQDVPVFYQNVTRTTLYTLALCTLAFGSVFIARFIVMKHFKVSSLHPASLLHPWFQFPEEESLQCPATPLLPPPPKASPKAEMHCKSSHTNHIDRDPDLIKVSATKTVTGSPLSTKPEQAPSDERLNLNTALEAELCHRLPGVGKKRAEAIIAYRQEHGRFVAVEELACVPGIGLTLLERYRPLITV